MLFMEPTETPYDLRFRFFGIPVRIHPMFWVITLLMGWGGIKLGVQYVLVWVACVFVSILVHEMGHVLMGQRFGSYGHIVLYGFGGLAIGSNHLGDRWQRIAVSFAGPLAGFVLLGVLLLGLWGWDPELFPYYLYEMSWILGLPIPEDAHLELLALQRLPPHLVQRGIHNMIFINLLWGLVNLLPVWPLDGGQISRELCESVWPQDGLVRSLGLSMLVAGLLAAHCVMVIFGSRLLPIPLGSTWTAILFAVLAIQSFQLMQQANAQRHWTEDHWHDYRD
jgi:stage IV sporulation protein FB